MFQSEMNYAIGKGVHIDHRGMLLLGRLLFLEESARVGVCGVLGQICGRSCCSKCSWMLC